MPGTIIAVDFDGTLVEHRFPEIGEPVPGAFEWLLKWQAAGALLILLTMRSDGQRHGDVLVEALEFCRRQGVEFWSVNHNPEQAGWTSSAKVYAHAYVDDAAMCCPVDANGLVDWSVLGPRGLWLIEERKLR